MANSQVDLTFFKVNLWDWILGTIELVGDDSSPQAWNNAWQRTFEMLRGEIGSSGSKVCPMKGTYTLYYLGRLEGTNRPLLSWSLERVRSEISKNGAYAVFALEVLEEEPELNLEQLWEKVKERFERKLVEVPASTNQGSVTIAYKLFHAGKIRT